MCSTWSIIYLQGLDRNIVGEVHAQEHSRAYLGCLNKVLCFAFTSSLSHQLCHRTHQPREIQGKVAFIRSTGVRHTSRQQFDNPHYTATPRDGYHRHTAHILLFRPAGLIRRDTNKVIRPGTVVQKTLPAFPNILPRNYPAILVSTAPPRYRYRSSHNGRQEV
jgi:hypothetical protein